MTELSTSTKIMSVNLPLSASDRSADGIISARSRRGKPRYEEEEKVLFFSFYFLNTTEHNMKVVAVLSVVAIFVAIACAQGIYLGASWFVMYR